MVVRLDKKQLLANADIVAPPSPAGWDDRNFELPPALLVGVFGLFMAFLGVMTLGFINPALVLPMAVNVIFVAAFCYVPAKWATMKPENPTRAMRWDEFREKGIETLTGHASAAEATVLVLLLPALVFAWGIAVVIIAALIF